MVATTARARAYKCMMVPRETSIGIKSEPRQVHIKGKEMNDPEFDTFPMSSQRAGLSASPATT